jgi:hypothetical protein
MPREGGNGAHVRLGLRPLAGALLRPASQKSEQTSEESIYLMRLLKISHAQIRKVPLPERFLPMFTSRMKQHWQPAATANMPVGCLPLGGLFSSSGATSGQPSLSVDVSLSDDFR